MSEAFVDTTILADVLLKPHLPKGKTAIDSLKHFTKTEILVYALKEFKNGPLRYYINFYNKMVTLESYSEALLFIHKISMSPNRYYASTAIEALAEFEGEMEKASRNNISKWQKKYGPKCNIERIRFDECRLSLKTRIFLAWKKRRKQISPVVFSLYCFVESDLVENRGRIEHHKIKCVLNKGGCPLADEMRKGKDDLVKIREAVKKQPRSNENDKRSGALKFLIKKKDELTEEMCRHLGDAVFVFFSPKNSIILTTNTRDHEPMAKAIGKKVQTP